MSHAKTSPKQDQGRDLLDLVPAFGTPWLTPFARFVPLTSSSKTSPDSQPRWAPIQENLLSEQSSLTWPKQGTWDLGFAYELLRLEPHTNASASSSLLPTPGANDSTGPESETRKRRQEKGTGGPALRDLKYLLPTPSATQNDGHDPEKFLARRERELEKGQNGNGFGLTLGMAVQLLPTPTAGDAHSSGSRNLPGSNAHPGTSLTDAIVRDRLLPTPTVNDARNSGGPSQSKRRSLPLTEIASDVSGGSTPRPSYVGKEPSEDVHPNQLTIEDV